MRGKNRVRRFSEYGECVGDLFTEVCNVLGVHGVVYNIFICIYSVRGLVMRKFGRGCYSVPCLYVTVCVVHLRWRFRMWRVQ